MEKIQTPYGEKNWSMIKKCLDLHDELVYACKKSLEYLMNDREENFVNIEKVEPLEKLLQEVIKGENE